MRPVLTLMVLCLALFTGTPARADARLAVPDRAACADAERQVKELFGAGSTQKPVSERRHLAARMLKEGISAADDVPGQYVMLREARNVAAEAGDLSLASSANDMLLRRFVIDDGDATCEMLSRAAKSADSAELCLHWNRLAIEMRLKNRLALAERAAIQSSTAAARAKNPGLLADTHAVAKFVDAALHLASHAEAAKSKLVTAHDDPAAFSDLGNYLCFVRGDWKAGAAALAGGDEPNLKAIGQREMRPPATSDEMFQLAEEWWKLPDSTARDVDPAEYKQRAAYWDRLAMPQLTGLQQKLAQRRLTDATLAAIAEAPGRAIDLLGLIDPAVHRFEGTWRYTDKGLSEPEMKSSIVIPYSPGPEYDLSMVFTRDAGEEVVALVVRLAKGWTQWCVGLNRSQIGFADVGSGWGSRGGKDLDLHNGQVYRTVVKVRRDHISGYIDDDLIIDLPTDGTGMDTEPHRTIDKTTLMSIGTWEATVTVQKLELVEISGHGQFVPGALKR